MSPLRITLCLAALAQGVAPLGASQDPSEASSIAEAIFAAQREEIRARSAHDTAEGFQAWRSGFAVKMRSIAEQWRARVPEGEDLLALARLFAYAQEWAAVDDVLTRYLAGGSQPDTAAPQQNAFSPQQGPVARSERVRARAQCGRTAGAREDLQQILEKEPRRFDLALFLYGLPALVEPAGRELGLRAIAHLEKRYEGDAYAPICASFARHLKGLGQKYERPIVLGRIARETDATPRLRLILYFRSSAPLTRAPLPFLKKLAERFAARRLAIEIAAPREGAAFWDRFRPASPQPSVEDEILALTAMCRALELPFPCALLEEPARLESQHDLRVLPHFVLLDDADRAVLFACGGEGYEWLEGAIDRLLPGGGAAREDGKE